MRKPRFLSPSSKSRWFENRTGFYLKYLADHKIPREPQASFMGVGSGLDARVKAEIMERSLGKTAIKGSPYHMETLFEKQVEEHNRDQAWKISEEVWKQYNASGAFENLWADIERSPMAPMMEDRIEGKIQGVPLLGLPDLVYIDADSQMKIIADFKVLGSTSKSGASPYPGYKVALEGWEKKSKKHGKAHDKYDEFEYHGMKINKAFLEDFNPDWAEQMSTYAWLLGSDVGAEDFIVRIECLACRTPKAGFRVKSASYMNRVSRQRQEILMQMYKQIWEAIEDGHIFDDLSEEDSRDRCEVLEMQAKSESEVPGGVHGPLKKIGRDIGNQWMRVGL